MMGAGTAAASSITRDFPCGNCGYNLRGLRIGRKCPECGHVIPAEVESIADPLLSGSLSRRWWCKWGLTLVFAAALASAILHVVFGATLSIAFWPPPIAHLSLRAAIALSWGVGVILATPPSMDMGKPKWSLRWTMRWTSRITQMLWLPAMVCAILAEAAGAFSPNQDALFWWTFVLSLVAGAGWPVYALLLHQVAEEIDLDDAPRRIGMALFTLPVLTLVLMLLPQRMFFFVLAIIAPLLLAWGWYLVGFARGVWEMRQYVAWGLRSSEESVDRDTRIAQKRAELEREAGAKVRPLPALPHAPPTKPGRIPDRRWR